MAGKAAGKQAGNDEQAAQTLLITQEAGHETGWQVWQFALDEWG